VRRGRLLKRLTIGWNAVEGIVALSAVLLVGLAANAALGWCWADPAAGLGIAALAAVEGVRTWRAESLAHACCD
jgi:hypothetical protein